MNNGDYTVADRILLAAKSLSESNQSFSAEDLVVKAWELYPEHFGLQGYASKYPDSNRVLTKIMGSAAALRKNGWIRKIGSKRYELTPLGAIQADSVASGAPATSSTRLAELDRVLVNTLRRMLSSSAVRKFQRGDALTFSDVCSLWNVSPRSTANILFERTAQANAAIELALAHSSQNESSLPGGLIVRRVDLILLQRLSSHIEDVFATELGVIRNRQDERRH